MTIRRTAMVMTGGMVLLACAALAPALLKLLDATFLGYRLADWYISQKTPDDWSKAPRIRPGLRYEWVRPDRTATIRIAHALGSWQSDRDRNTIMALNRSLARHFFIEEVDLAPGGDDQLYCFHGTDGRLAIVPQAESGNLCTLDALIASMRTNSFILVLDLKGDFARSAAIVAKRVPPALRGRVVFQLYDPEDVSVFNTLPPGFAGPIVTLYRTMRTVHHLDPELTRIGARVVTVPFARIDEFGTWGSRSARTLLTHPIENCVALTQATHAGFSGGYMDSDLICPSLR